MITKWSPKMQNFGGLIFTIFKEKGELSMIIDSHVHIGGSAVGFHMTSSMVLESMNKYHIDISIVSNGDAVEFDHNQNPIPKHLQVNQNDALKQVIQFARSNPKRIYCGFWCKPFGETISSETKQLIKKNRDVVVALKVHPLHSNLAFDHEKMIPYLELAKEFSLPVIIHTGKGYNDSPQRVKNMALQYPMLTFIMAHMGLGTDNQLALSVMEEAPNLYADTTWVPVSTTLEAIKKYGSQRVVFGSDNPIDGVDTYFCNPKGEPSLYQEYFNSLKAQLSIEDYENLMWRTAKNIFQINT